MHPLVKKLGTFATAVVMTAGASATLPIIPTQTAPATEAYQTAEYDTPNGANNLGKLEPGYYYKETNGKIVYAQPSATSSESVFYKEVNTVPQNATEAHLAKYVYQKVCVGRAGNAVVEDIDATTYKSFATSPLTPCTEILTVVSAETSQAEASIAFGATAQNGNSAASVTVTGPVVTGLNTIGVVGALTQTDLTLGSVTWNGVTATLIATQSNNFTFNNEEIGEWYVVNPASSAPVVINRTTAINALQGVVGYYTGANQTGIPDASHVTTSTTGTTLVSTVTTVADKSWAFIMFRDDNGLGTAGTNAHLVNGVEGVKYFDSNADITPAGSFSMTITGLSLGPGSEGAYSIMASFAPVSTPVSVVGPAPWGMMIGR